MCTGKFNDVKKGTLGEVQSAQTAGLLPFWHGKAGVQAVVVGGAAQH